MRGFADIPAAARRMWRSRVANRRNAVYYVVESADWVIRQDGVSITQALRQALPGVDVHLTHDAAALSGQVIHFGSLWSFLSAPSDILERNRVVLTIFHGDPQSDPVFAGHLKGILDKVQSIGRVVTAASIMERRLLDFGFPKEKLTRIPLGVEVARFRSGSADKAYCKNRLGIPAGRFCIGSFQKDGNGWGEGLEPKLIKGPDLFCDALELLARRLPVFALLTGPARGYVKHRLELAGIPFRHAYLKRFADIPAYYAGLDAYLISSREEGGPKAILESMACSVPLVTTNVGMAPDVLTDGIDALVSPCLDAKELADRLHRLLTDRDMAQGLTQAGARTVEAYDWGDIVRTGYVPIYRELLGNA